MGPHEAFVRSIAESLYDDAPRLVYADWLHEHGDPERAEFIRVQCELEPIRDQYEIDRAAELHRREEEALGRYQPAWFGPGMEDWHCWREDGASAEFRRGFVDTVWMPVSIGFRPGFIRIQDCRFPGDEDEYNRPWWEVYSWQDEQQQIGVPDSDDAEYWANYPCGYAGDFARRLRNQAYVFGWDRFADKRGRVHST